MTIGKWLLLAAGICTSAQAFAAESDAALFERVEPSAYRDMVRDAASAYGAEHYDDSFAKFRRTACAGDKLSPSSSASSDSSVNS